MCVCVVNALHVGVSMCVISVIGLNMIFTLECTVFVDLIKIYARFIPSLFAFCSHCFFVFFYLSSYKYLYKFSACSACC